MKTKRTLPLYTCVLLASCVLTSCQFIENQYISGGTWGAQDIEIELDDESVMTISSLNVRIREINQNEIDNIARGCITMKLSEYYYHVVVTLDYEDVSISYDHVSGTNVYYYDISDWEGYDMSMTLAFRDDFLKVEVTLYELNSESKVSKTTTIEAEEIVE